MNLWLGINNSSPETINKDIAYYLGLSGTLREETSLDQITVDIEIHSGMRVYNGTLDNYTDNNTFDTAYDKLLKCNYVKTEIETLNDGANIDYLRYFVDDKIIITHSGTGASEAVIVRLILRCDVLDSYKTGILNQDALIIAQQNASGSDLFYNTGVYLPSGKRKTSIQTAVKFSTNLLSVSNRSLILVTTSKPCNSAGNTFE